MRDAIVDRAETIARDLLGDPNERLSRYGKYVGETWQNTSNHEGKYAGKWYDFSTGQKGD
ncbi:putative conjugative transfer TraI domain protein, partial [Orientia tsutsugamushi str. TA716]